jgi:low temperature requirement protein LtrA
VADPTSLEPLHSVGHHLSRMSGRDPGETHRSATPLELLFDLAFVVAFGIAADQLAHLVAIDDVAPGVIG